MIDSFQGEHAFLSNFAASEIEFEGIVFPTVEHAFQAAKTLNMTKRKEIAALPSPGHAKRAGRSVELRPDWEEIKIDVMLECVRKKFQIPELREALDNTGSELLVEGNWWKDTFWGICEGRGQNNLGKILMKVREENRSEN